MKKTILLTGFILLLSTFSYAQDKYKYASVIWTTAHFKTYTSIDGADYQIEDSDLKKSNENLFNMNPLIKKVKELESQGWEVINFDSDSHQGYTLNTAYLRKKQ